MKLSSIPNGLVTRSNIEVLTYPTGNDNHTNMIVLPGILADALGQHRAVLNTLHDWCETISFVDYRENPRYDNTGIIEEVANMVHANIVNDVQTQLLGTSLGGLLAVGVLSKLRHKGYSRDKLNRFVRTIIVDTPADRTDLVLGPLPPTAAPRVAKLFNSFTPSDRSNRTYGAGILNLFKSPPKDGQIELVEGGLTAEEIKRQAVRGLSGNSFTAWHMQLVEMLNKEHTIAQQVQELNVIYMACLENNATIHQPQAKEKWMPNVRMVMDVHTPHCAYLQARPSWEQALKDALTNSKRFATTS